jgi:hypothetical protein
MELTADVPGVRLHLDHLDQRTVGREPAQIQAVLDECVAVFVVDFVTMTMSFAHLRHTIDLRRQRASAQSARIRAKSHRTAHVGHMLLVFHQ